MLRTGFVGLKKGVFSRLFAPAGANFPSRSVATASSKTLGRRKNPSKIHHCQPSKPVLKPIPRVFLAAVILFSSGLLFGCDSCASEDNQPLLRLHIRANSNLAADQAVKLVVRDAVIAYLEKELKDVRDFETAKKEVCKRMGRLQEVSDAVLKSEGFSYKSAAKLANEYFPTKTYGEVTVESGYYDALVINLGNGAGDNWWCVIYPPLCYFEAASEQDVAYKSKIGEIIKKYF